MATDPDLDLVPAPEARERNWLPLTIAIAVVLILAVAGAMLMGRGKPNAVAPVSAAPDAYATSLPVSNLVMSESSSLAGGKVTYLDGHIANRGTRTVTAVVVQVLFRNTAHEVMQNETQSLKFIRTRNPYIDVESVSAAPLKPGGERDFRLIFDAVSPNWDGAYPELRILHVETK